MSQQRVHSQGRKREGLLNSSDAGPFYKTTQAFCGLILFTGVGQWLGYLSVGEIGQEEKAAGSNERVVREKPTGHKNTHRTAALIWASVTKEMWD